MIGVSREKKPCDAQSLFKNANILMCSGKVNFHYHLEEIIREVREFC